MESPTKWQYITDRALIFTVPFLKRLAGAKVLQSLMSRAGHRGDLVRAPGEEEPLCLDALLPFKEDILRLLRQTRAKEDRALTPVPQSDVDGQASSTRSSPASQVELSGDPCRRRPGGLGGRARSSVDNQLQATGFYRVLCLGRQRHGVDSALVFVQVSW